MINGCAKKCCSVNQNHLSFIGIAICGLLFFGFCALKVGCDLQALECVVLFGFEERLNVRKSMKQARKLLLMSMEQSQVV